MTTLAMSDVLRVCPMNRRTVQQWVALGIVRPESGTWKAGTGTHNKFSESALEDVKMLSLLHDIGVDNNHKKEFLRHLRADAGLRAALEAVRKSWHHQEAVS